MVLLSKSEFMKWVKIDKTQVYSYSVSDSSVVTNLEKGEQLIVLERRWEWVLVKKAVGKKSSMKGWVKSDHLTGVTPCCAN